jgi:uncharacterized protein YyaL (SSP411 family)
MNRCGIAVLSCSLLLFGTLSACKNKTATSGPPPAAPRLTSQAASDGPSPIHLSLGSSTISWRQFTPTTIQYAREAQKMLLVYVTSTQQMAAAKVFDAIIRDPQTVKEINEHFVPVLVDGDANREMGILAAMLCSEIKKPVSFPFMMWLTAEGNPVAWLPLDSNAADDSTISRILQSQSVVINMWNTDREYIVKNSAFDNENRRQRYKAPAVKTSLPSENQALLLGMFRQLHSQFDSISGNIDGMGTLLPTSIQECFSHVASHPALDDMTRERARTMIAGNARALLRSAAVDALDGGFYTSRTDANWSTVTLDRNGLMQTRAIQSFAMIGQALDDAAIIAAAEKAMQFHEVNFALDGGLYANIAAISLMSKEAHCWSIETLKATLDASEFALLKHYYDWRDMGNVPPESDPRREFFRLNLLVPKHEIADSAASQSITPEQASALLASAHTKLLVLRKQSLEKSPMPPKVAQAQVTLQTASSYATLFAATGKEEYRSKATSILAAFRQAFHREDGMHFFQDSLYPTTTLARAGLIALAQQTALDVYDITLDDAALTYADSLSALLVKDYLVDGNLEEVPASARFINLPITDQTMIFDKSTVGLVKQNLSRMHQLSREVPVSLYQAAQLPLEKIEQSPVVHTDYLLGLLYQENHAIISLPADASDDLRQAVTRLPLRLFTRKVVPGNGGKVTFSLHRADDATITDAATLKSLYQPK